MRDSYENLKKEKYNIDTWVQAVLSGNPRAELAFNAGAHPSFRFAQVVNYALTKPSPLKTTAFTRRPKRVWPSLDPEELSRPRMELFGIYSYR